MKHINIAKTIVKKRKEKGITQDDLANYIGVSKASVSKWETGQSYPDITFLPQLATYFNISIDDLMGYEPQLTKEDISKLQRELANDFATKPFDEVMDQCRTITKKYFSCFPVLIQIGTLFFNYSMLPNDAEKTKEIISEAKELFVRVKNESDDAGLVKHALHLEALCSLTLGDPNEVVELLEGTTASMTSSEVLLASAYQMLGNNNKARTVLQIGIYQYMLRLIDFLKTYMTLYNDDEESFYEIYRRANSVAEAFNIKELHPTILMTFDLTAAQGFLQFNNIEKALTILEEYAELVTGDIYPLKLHGDDFFTLINSWFDEFELGTALPRDEKTIRQSMIDSVESNPAFSVLSGEMRFQHIVNKIKMNY